VKRNRRRAARVVQGGLKKDLHEIAGNKGKGGRK
jgi:hypothetical protein